MNLKNYIPWEQDQLDESLKLKKKLENPIFWNRASINLPWEGTKAWRIFEIVLKEFRRRQSGVSDFSFLRRGLEEPYEVKYQTFSKFLFSEGAKSGYFSFSQLFFHLSKIFFFLYFIFRYRISQTPCSIPYIKFGTSQAMGRIFNGRVQSLNHIHFVIFFKTTTLPHTMYYIPNVYIILFILLQI